MHQRACTHFRCRAGIWTTGESGPSRGHSIDDFECRIPTRTKHLVHFLSERWPFEGPLADRFFGLLHPLSVAPIPFFASVRLFNFPPKAEHLHLILSKLE